MNYLINCKNEWKDLFNEYDNLNTEKIYDIITYLYKNNNNIFPKLENIFRCFTYFNPKMTKVVIIGQDPYHKINQACGLCFGIETISKNPPSLKNIERELYRSLNINITDYSLEKWARQGILLLNASLTVLNNSPNIHSKYWYKFTQYIIEYLNKLETPIIFVAWGKFAHDLLININSNRHHIIITSHPSPLSALRKYKSYPAFIGSNCFIQINEYLSQLKSSKIEW